MKNRLFKCYYCKNEYSIPENKHRIIMAYLHHKMYCESVGNMKQYFNGINKILEPFRVYN